MSGLPKGWVEATLGDVLEPRSEKADPSTVPDLPFLGLEDVEPYSGRVIGYGSTADMKSSVALFSKGDLLFGRLRPYLQKILIADCDGAASAEFIVMKTNQYSHLGFFSALLRSDKFLEYTALVSSGDRPRVSYDSIADFNLALPPLAEQKRMVAKLDALNAKSARARTELARIETLVSRFKQAVLSKAFSGELTREWRVQRANLTSWQYLPLSKLIADGPTNGWSPKADGKVGGLKSLKLSATSSGTLRLNENTIKYLDQTLPGNSKFWLLVNDILIQRANSLELLGTTVLFEGPPSEFIYPDLMMRVRADESKALPKYLATFLNSDGARTYFRANATGTAGNMPKINGTTVRETRVPAPPLEEQHEIVRRIESAFARIDRLAKEAKRALELVGRLDEAILAKAFRGELVPQDEGDEPAEHLLARIRAERETAPKGKRGQGRR